MVSVPKQRPGCLIYDRHHEGSLAGGGTSDDQLAGKHPFADGSLLPSIRRTTCSTAAKPICQVGCLSVVIPTPASSAHSSSSKPSRPISLPQIRPTRLGSVPLAGSARRWRKSPPCACRDGGSGSDAGRYQHRAIVQRYFGVFRDNTGMAQEGLAKRAQALAAGIDRAEGSLRNSRASEALFHQVFGGGGGGLGIIEADDIAGESGILRSISTIGSADCCRRLRPSSRIPTALTTIPST